MKILAIDTAHGICSTAIAENGTVISSITDNEPAKQAERLFVTINKLLHKAGLSYGQLSAVAVNIGPGSFTGLRIGLAAARGIALAGKIPVIGVTSFEALDSTGDYGDVLVCLDARRNQIYAQLFSHHTPVGEGILLDYSDITKSTLNRKQINIIGNGKLFIEQYLKETEIDYNFVTNFELPDAAMVANSAFYKISHGIHTPASPLYIRKPDAVAKTPQS